MKILVVWPPHVPSYFNAGHHLPLFMVGGYLRRELHEEVTCVDAGALNFTWKDLANRLVDTAFDVVAVMNEFGNADGVATLARYVRHLRPDAKLVTFGRLSYEVPELFRRLDLDAIVSRGDYEAGVAAYVRSLRDGAPASPVAGTSVRTSDGGWLEPADGIFLDASEWALPDIREIPYEAYDRMYLDDSKKFCGIPERRELVVPVARGCPVGCDFCEVPRQQEARERRRSVEAVVGYIEESFAAAPFEYASMYAPTFTLSRSWVLRLAGALIARGSRYPYKCVTTIFHLDRELIATMAKSGCVRISIGLETLDPPSKRSLPKLKRAPEERLFELARDCSDHGVELNCFVILGLPGQSVSGARYTIEQVRAAGARVRPTIYTPYDRLDADMSAKEIDSFDRTLFAEGAAAPNDMASYYDLALGTERRPTRVMDHIPLRSAV